ncbi:MAG: 7-cyano-7-deazaguanine synthase [Nitrospiraceae bacterium]|nr:7-cyano-7-deazaguanine synthase [Nitrospiraceae bacterium]
MKSRAVALYSGGLDSTLAVIAALRQGIEVTAVTFLNHFGCDITDKSSCSKDPFSAAEKFGFTVKLCHLSEKFIDIVKNPKFGHGRNMNPCMDCRILMLKEAKAFMEMTGAEFIITGEVLGQRPMSQRRDALNIIDREAGLKGLVLRPLSAKLLKPTIAEENGLVDRELLYDFGGRTRKPQMALAEEYGLTDYPAPAGGCLLTEPNYSYRLKELLDHAPDPSLTDLQLLRIGRHFRLSRGCKAVVGRDRSENDELLALTGDEGTWMRVIGYGSPVTLLRGAAENDEVVTAAALCARYSDAGKLPEADVKVTAGAEESRLKVMPAPAFVVEGLKIQKKQSGKSLQRI